ncbi:hypothetical protein HK405_015282 [Cladochytrium tenue]|nr:hypothetical protein HK405_015282 [Cladochytrium tenue]
MAFAPSPPQAGPIAAPERDGRWHHRRACPRRHHAHHTVRVAAVVMAMAAAASSVALLTAANPVPSGTSSSTSSITQVLAGITSDNFTLTHYSALIGNQSVASQDLRAAVASSSTPITLFAFTDAAYDALSSAYTATDTLSSVLNYLACYGSFDLATTSTTSSKHLTTLLSYTSSLNRLGFGQNQTITISTINGTSYLTTGTQSAKILGEYPASNGFVYVVDKVVVPPSSFVTTYKNTLGNTGFASFIATSNIAAGVNDLESITVFLPSSDGVFEFETLYNSLNLSADVRAAIVESHIIPGIYYASDLAAFQTNAQVNTYLSNTSLTFKSGTTLATSASATTTVTIETPDILIDAGVVHIVSSFLLADVIASGKLPSPLPTLAQIYPDGYSTGPSSYAKDFPLGTVVGSVVGGVALIAIVVVIGAVIVHRRRVLRRMRELDEAEEEELEGEEAAEALAAAKKLGALGEDGVAHVLRPTDSADFSDTTAAGGATPVSARRLSKRTSAAGAGAAAAAVAGGDDEEEDDGDDEEEEEKDEEVQRAMAEARRILDYRRSQWSSGDGPAGSGTGSGGGGGGGGGKNRVSVASKASRASRRASQMPPAVDVADPRERQRENVRNSWWSATGVGAGVNDPAVQVNQARREEMRRSWWSGDADAAAAAQGGAGRPVSTVSSAGGSGGGGNPAAWRSSFLAPPAAPGTSPTSSSRPRSSFLFGGGGGPSGEAATAAAAGDSLGLPASGRSRSSRVDLRRSWWLSPADTVLVEEEGGSGAAGSSEMTDVKRKSQQPPLPHPVPGAAKQAQAAAAAAAAAVAPTPPPAYEGNRGAGSPDGDEVEGAAEKQHPGGQA